MAAGASYPQSGTTGTGIYAGREGSLISVMVKEGEGERKLYKAQVPKVRYRQYKNTPKLKRLSQASANIMEETSVRANLSGIRLMKDPQIENYNSVLMDLTKSHDVFEELCHGDLCCSFGYNVEVLSTSGNISSHYTYRLGVFEGRRSYEKDQWSDIKVCAVYACANEDPHSCGQVPETEHNSSPIRITYLHIKGSFPKVKKFLIMPTTVDDELNPLSGGKFIWKNEGRK